MSKAENDTSRLARIEIKLDTVITGLDTVCAQIGNKDTGLIAHEQRIRVLEGRCRAIVGISTAILVCVFGMAVKLIVGG